MELGRGIYFTSPSETHFASLLVVAFFFTQSSSTL